MKPYRVDKACIINFINHLPQSISPLLIRSTVEVARQPSFYTTCTLLNLDAVPIFPGPTIIIPVLTQTLSRFTPVTLDLCSFCGDLVKNIIMVRTKRLFRQLLSNISLIPELLLFTLR